LRVKSGRQSVAVRVSWRAWKSWCLPG
jgi:hypothetical protein